MTDALPDVVFEDRDVCILHPNSQRGIWVFTKNSVPNGQPIRTGEWMKANVPSFKERDIFHPYVFFRAPYFAETPYYDAGAEAKWIRVDPDKTFVYSSEIRAASFQLGSKIDTEVLIQNSRKSLAEYFEVITQNAIKFPNTAEFNVWYNLFTSEARSFAKPLVEAKGFSTNASPPFPFSAHPINRNSEILVRTTVQPGWYISSKNPNARPGPAPHEGEGEGMARAQNSYSKDERFGRPKASRQELHKAMFGADLPSRRDRHRLWR